MEHAYKTEYLDDAMHTLGEAFDFAVNACRLDLEIFLELFISTGFSKTFAEGEPATVCGMSGSELVLKVLSLAGLSAGDKADKQTAFGQSAEYRCGYVLAYYQWYTARSFKNIKETFSVDELYGFYRILQRHSEDEFVKAVEESVKKKNLPTALQIQRKKCGISQRELAERSGVNLRTLQQYEVGAKDINKASVISVIRMSKVLSCSVEDLIEQGVSL